MKKPLRWEYKVVCPLPLCRCLNIIQSPSQYGQIVLTAYHEPESRPEFSSTLDAGGGVTMFAATARLWQEKGWLGPLPKRVPKVFRDALEGVE